MMPEEALQVAFEVKTACDELSRRLLRWHWEQRPGSHTLDAVLQYVARRQKESPDYYDRMPDLSTKTSWKQLDTTFCMRVLLDPEKDAANPVDLLGNTARPAAARKACNAVRVARNQAAHAAEPSDGAQAAILFNEAIEYLEQAYLDTAFSESELAKCYRQAEQFLNRCGAREPIAEPKAKAQKRTESKAAAKPRAASGKKTTVTQKSNKVKNRTKGGSHTAAHKKKKRTGMGKVFWVFVAALVLGLLVRAVSMGLL